MKSKLMLDLSIYMIAPIILCNVVESKDLTFTIASLIVLMIAYSMSCKRREARINLSGVVFTSLFLILTLFNREAGSSYQVYIYDTYFLILLGISILVFTVIDKDIFRRIYLDIQRAKGNNNLSIWSNIKKSELSQEFRYLSYVVSSHLIILGMIKVYSISRYGKEMYVTTQEFEVWLSVVFLLGGMYMISKIMAKSKLIKNNKKNKNKSKYNLNNKRVVNFEQYKNANK